MATTVRIKVLRPLCIRGERLDRGLEVPVSAIDAIDLVESGRCAFVDDRDRAACMEARRDAVRRMLRDSTQRPGDPWRPL